MHALDTFEESAKPFSPTLDFLRAILPAEGLKCAFVAETKRNSFFATTEELAAFLLTEDALGRTAYHACATYKVTGRRTQSNALAARSFWLDIDAGEEKDVYVDAQEAAEAVLAFCQRVSLPPPLLVGSGLGIHAYWPVAESVPAADWQRAAQGLKALCAAEHLMAGRERTADLASILRPPGTHWRKQSPARLVRAGPLVGPYALRELTDVFNRAQPALPARGARATWALGSSTSSPSSSGSAPRSSLSPLAAAAGHIADHEPAFADAIADQCAQMGLLRSTRGRVPEPHWYAALGVLAFCEDGEELAHAWSSGHEQYSAQETAEKLERARRLTGATTCAHFASVADPSVCQRCPLLNRVNSPVVLGRKSPWQAASSPPSSSPSAESSASPASSSVSTPSSGTTFSPTADDGVALPLADFAAMLPTVPAPFYWSNTFQLIYTGEKKNGDAYNVVVSHYPIFLESVQTGEVQGETFSYRFRQWLPHEGWFDISIGAEVAMGSSGISRLFGHGAAIRERELFRDFVVLSIDQWNASNRLNMRYDQFGWKEDETGFLYGKNLYAVSGVSSAQGSEEVRTRSQWLAPKPGGSLEKWSAAAASLFAQGCEPQSFALLASFAAPLMRFHATAEGGAIVSLQSEASGSGKTTALTAAASVWGRMDGLSLVNIDTGVAKSLTLSTLGNLPVIYDEFGNRDPEIVKEFVIVFTNGRDKMRGTVDGTIRHTQASWQTLLLAACNLSLVDLVNSVGGTDAPGFRILEFGNVSLPAHISHKGGDALRKALEANSGHAGDAYLRYIVQPPVVAFIRAALRKWTDDLWDRTGLSSEHRYRVRAVASVAVASVIVKKLGLLPFSPERITGWAVEQLRGMESAAPITGRGSVRAISTLSHFLNEHISNTLVVAKGGSRTQVPLQRPTNKLSIRFERETARLAISEEVLMRWMTQHNVSFRGFLDALQKQGLLLERRRMAALGVGTDFPSVLIPCVEINMNDPRLSGVVAPVEQMRREA